MKNTLKRISLVFMLQLCLFMSSAFAEGISITIPTEVRVNGPLMTLGEIADIKGDDSERMNRLMELKIGSAPSPGRYLLLTKELLGMRLVATGFDLNNISWNIPERMTVTTNSQTLSGQRIIDKGMLTIKEQIGANISSADQSILLMDSVQDIIAPVGDLVLTSSLPYGIRYNTPTTVRMTVTVNGQVLPIMNVKFDVKLYGEVAVAARQVRQGEILTSENIHYKRMDTGRLGNGYFTDLSKVMGLETRRPLTPGMVVTTNMLNKPMLIKRGSLVNVVARIGSMEVIVVGKAMQNGYEGQLIRVQNVNSNKFISAKVLDEGTVQVLTYSSNTH